MTSRPTPVEDLCTSDNCLSVWFIDDNKRDLPHVLAALAATRDKPDKVDYVLFPYDYLDGAAIETRETQGHTADAEVNGCHRDLTHLSAAKVLDLTKRVWHENVELERVDKLTVVLFIADLVRGGRIPLERLRPRVKERVQPLLDGPEGDPRKPK